MITSKQTSRHIVYSRKSRFKSNATTTFRKKRLYDFNLICENEMQHSYIEMLSMQKYRHKHHNCLKINQKVLVVVYICTCLCHSKGETVFLN